MKVRTDDREIRKPVRIHKNLHLMLKEAAVEKHLALASLMNDVVEEQSQRLVDDASLWPIESEAYYPSHGRTQEMSSVPISMRISQKTRDNIQTISQSIGFKPVHVINTLVYMYLFGV